MAVVDPQAGQLRQLLLRSLQDAGPLYSAVVRWTLSRGPQASSLLAYAQQQPALQHVQLPARDAYPADMQQCVLQLAGQCCRSACDLPSDRCHKACDSGSKQCSPDAGSKGLMKQHPAATKQQDGKPVAHDPTTQVLCGELSQAATRLAKLHGHLLAHCLAPDIAEQLTLLLTLLTAAPLGSSSSSRQEQAAADALQRHAAEDAAGGSSGSAWEPPVLGCRTCAARYAAKALECCSRLLTCLPLELLQSLAASPHLHAYSPSLAAQLARGAATAATAAATGSGQPLWQQQAADVTPAAAARGCRAGGAPGSAPSGRLSSAQKSSGGSSVRSLFAAGQATPASRGSGAGRLSGLGLLLPNTPGAVGAVRPSSAGASLSTGSGKAANAAAICNREKSRDAFFAILRQASNRLCAVRDAQAAAAAAQAVASLPARGDGPDAASGSVAARQLAELLSDMSVAARQLLLQLAPGNVAALAELFMACVLQAASSGEPILEPALVLMAERDPGKFQKLQQRLADRPPVAAAGAGAAAVAAAGTPQSASSASPAAPGGGGGSRGAVAGSGGSRSRLQPHRQQPAGSGGRQQQHLQLQEQSGALTAHRARIRPVQQQQQPHLLATASTPCLRLADGPSHPRGASSQARRQIAPQQCLAPAQQAQQRMAAATGQSPLNAACLSPLFAAAAAAAGASPVPDGPAALSTGAQPLARQTATKAAAPTPTSSEAPAAAVAPGPSSAPPKLQQLPAVGASPAKAAVGGQHTHAAGTGGARGQQPDARTALLLQLLPEVPAGQHVLLLFLHAADSATFNRSLLSVMLARAERLLSSTPGSFAAVGGLGQQATAVVALASYCGYLAFVAGATSSSMSSSRPDGAAAGAAATPSRAGGVRDSNGSRGGGGTRGEATPHQQQQEEASPVRLQQLPAVDVAALLSKVLTGSSNPTLQQQPQPQHTPARAPDSGGTTAADGAWRVALAVPFAASFLRFAAYRPAAGGSGSVAAAARSLAAVQALPCLDPGHSAFGSLGVCLSSTLHSCAPLLPWAHQQAQGLTATAQPADACDTDWLCGVMAAGNGLVDAAFWYVCCPGLAQVETLLRLAAANAASPSGAHHARRASSGTTPTAAATPAAAPDACGDGTGEQQQQQQQRRQPGAATAAEAASPPTPAAAHPAAAGAADAAPPSGPPASSDIVAAPAAGAAEQRAPGQGAAAAPHAASDEEAAQGSGRSGGTPGQGAATAAAVPPALPLLVPRVLPVLEELPAVVVAALEGAGGPLVQQQLQQAFLQQYSTDDNPVRMRDVLTVINGILCANCLSRGLSAGVPPVLQRRLAALEAEVAAALPHSSSSRDSSGREDAAAGGAAAAATNAAQELGQHVLATYTRQLAAATHEALEAAVQTAADHAKTAAAAACAALLPADVPPPAAAAAAALVASTCKANAAQRLMQEVPPLVLATLADGADDLLRLLPRQWAAAAAAATAPIRADAGSAAAAGGAAQGGPRHAAGTCCAAPAGDSDDADAEPTHCSTATTSSSNSSKASKAPVCTSPAPPTSSDADVAAAAPAVSDQGALQGLSLLSLSGPDAAAACPTTTGSEDAEAASASAAIVAAFLEAALPQLQAAARSGGSSSSSSTRQGCAPVDVVMPQAPAGLIAAAEAAAHQLLRAVASGATTLQELEELLLPGLDGGPASSSSSAAADTQQQRQQLALLLGGALVHAVLTSSWQRQAVWGSSSSAPAHGPAVAMPHHFLKLPAALMKAVRSEAPLWLLAQLRAWMQRATLGQG